MTDLGYGMIPGQAAAHILTVQKARKDYICEGIFSLANEDDLSAGGPKDSSIWREPFECLGTIYKSEVYVRQEVRSQGVASKTYRCCRHCAIHYNVIEYGR